MVLLKQAKHGSPDSIGLFYLLFMWLSVYLIGNLFISIHRFDLLIKFIPYFYLYTFSPG